MKHSIALAAALATLGLAGCSSTGVRPAAVAANPAAAPQKNEVEYVTGSRLPRSRPTDQPVRAVSKDDWRAYESSVLPARPKEN